jgi:hypothetical protein
MTVEEKQEALRKTVENLRERAPDMTSEERQDGLIDVGCAASAVDVASLDDPDMESIREETDNLVDEAERVVTANDQRDALNRSLPTRVREISNRRRM